MGNNEKNLNITSINAIDDDDDNDDDEFLILDEIDEQSPSTIEIEGDSALAVIKELGFMTTNEDGD